MKSKPRKNATPEDLRLPGLRRDRQGAAALRRMSKGAQVVIVALFTRRVARGNVAWSEVLFMMGIIIRRTGRRHAQ